MIRSQPVPYMENENLGADFPFGSASGRLILEEGGNKISEADFELRNDGRV